MKYQKLPKAFKSKWIKALRSKKFTQGAGQLHQKEDIGGKENDTYCCLGVACIISGHTNKKLFALSFISDCKKWDVPKSLIGINPTTEKLAKLNDGDKVNGINKKTFKGIATWIEKNL